MNQGKLEMVKQEMARVNVDILGISKLKWTGMGELYYTCVHIYYSPTTKMDFCRKIDTTTYHTEFNIVRNLYTDLPTFICIEISYSLLISVYLFQPQFLKDKPEYIIGTKWKNIIEGRGTRIQKQGKKDMCARTWCSV